MPRALWKGAISFGLVTIPVSLYPAKNAREDLSFHLLHKSDLTRVHNKRVDEEDHEVAYDDVVRGYEFERDQYVVIGDSDFEAASVEATQSIDIIHFVESQEIDLAFYDTPYYTEPSKVGRKAYALLRETLKRTNKVGVAKIVIRERQHLCAVIADGPVLLAFTLRWPYQLRDASELELPDDNMEKAGVSSQELKMAEQLVESMTAEWAPDDYRDTYRDSLLQLIEERVKSGELAKVSEAPKPAARGENVVDIMALLKQSMEQRKAGKVKAESGSAKAEPGEGGAAKTKPEDRDGGDSHERPHTRRRRAG